MTRSIDSRQSRDSSSIRRRRNASNADIGFTTYEEIERSDFAGVKRDRTHERSIAEKLAGSIAKAFGEALHSFADARAARR